MEVYQTAEQITIRQSKCARKILERFSYENAHSVGNPMEINARLVPPIEGKKLSLFVANPAGKDVGAVKRVLRNIARTLNYGITYE
ncbi:hypothetical protein PF004_g12615 [Phytophthora fragariae]|uniref:Uncharacterized protein n=1 Tax=Phytophthora fragariae TaxID=53985 RepID=A0A6G0NUL2_9STRA|nr:hypothetical protein PF004_g12615 [Phytophthora fragariae]